MNVIGFIRSKELAWRKLFLNDKSQPNELGRVALADLRTFCYGTKSVFSEDPLEMARRAGRREVYERIMNYLHYDYSKQLSLDEELIDE